MRFFLLARARSSGLVRLLSERAYESRSAAVEAASATASAGAIDLGDDEVLAVDLDAAGPVLVLRVQAPVAAVAPVPEPPAAPVAMVAAGGIFAPAAPAPSSFGPPPVVDENPELLDVGPEPAVRLQARFPLFGADDDAPEEGLAETLRRVARRMEADLTISGLGEWAAADDSWDARTLDDYALPDDTHMSGAREEGRLRIDAAERLRNDDAALSREADDRHHRHDAGAESVAELLTDADVRYDDESCAATDRDGAGESDRGDDVRARNWDDDRDARVSEPRPWSGDEMPAEAIDAGALVADDRTLDLLPEYPEEAFEPDAISEPATEEMLPVDDVDVTDTTLTEPVTDSFRLEAGPESDATPLDDERERDAAAFGPEPAPYRPVVLDFAMWVCADCVYQRTCRKAGVASPATCGNFQWRSL